MRGQNKGGKAEVKWRYNYFHNPDNPLTEKPKLFFSVKSFKCDIQESGNIEIYDEIAVEVFDDYGEPFKNLDYKLVEPDGNEVEGDTGEQGKIEETNLIPGEYEIEFSGRE